MGQISSAIKICGDAVRYLRGPNVSNVYVGPGAQSHVSPLQDAKITTQTAPKASEDTTKTPCEPDMANVCLHEIQSHIPPPQDRSIIRKTPNEKGEPISSSEDVSSEIRTCMTQVASVEPVQTILPSLPTEIILIVAQYLAPSSLMSLTYSCRTIRYKMGVSIEDLLGKKKQKVQLSENALSNNLPKMVILNGEITHSLPTMPRDVHHSERLTLLYMLDRDEKVPLSKAVCADCADTHDRSLFSSKSLAQPSCERRCLGSVGRVWICPHWKIDHNLVTSSAEPRDIHYCRNTGALVTMDEDDVNNETTPRVTWRILKLHGNNDAPSKEAVDDILRLIGINVCKHLQFADAFVSRLYSPDCKKLRSFDLYCRCSSCVRQLSRPHHGGYIYGLTKYTGFRSGGNCESCGTNVHFQIRADRNGQETLELVVQRKIGMFQGCTDPAWIEQVNDPSEFDELERKWYVATDVIRQTLQDTCPVP